MNRFVALLVASALLPAVVDSALKGAVLLAVVAVTVLLMRNVSAATRHLVWLLAILGLLLLPLLSTALPGWRILPNWATVPAAATAPAPRPDAEPILPAATARPLPTALAEPASALHPSIVSSFGATQQSHSASLADGAGSVAAWLGGVWLVVATLLLSRLILSFVLLRVSTRHAIEIANGPLHEALRAACRQLGLRQRVRLLVDERRIVPVVWGIFRPRLLLPGASRAWDESRLRAVLLHELAHVKRRDLLVVFLTSVACAIHWFNPLAWLAAWRLRVERERACDDLVLAAGIKASDYAEHLLHVATTLEIASPAGALAMAAPSRLEGRLLAVLNQKLRRGTVPRSVAALAVVLALGLIIPMAMLRAQDKTPPAPAPRASGGTGTIGTSNDIEGSAADPSHGSGSAETGEHPKESGTADLKDRGKAPVEVPLLGSDKPVAQTKPASKHVQPHLIQVNADGTFKADEKAVSLEELKVVLSQWDSNTPVLIFADLSVGYAHVARAVDACRAAKITNISVRPHPQAGAEANAPTDKTEHPPQTSAAANPRAAERPAENEGTKAVAAGEGARARLRFAEQQLQRVSELERQKLISAAELDRAKTEVDVLKAELAGDEKQVVRIRLGRAERELERLTELHAQKTVSSEERDRAQLQVEVLRAELAGDRPTAARARLQHAEREFARVSELKQQNAVSAEQLDRARLELEVLRAELAADPLAAGRARLQHAEGELERLLALSKENLVSREVVDRAKAEADLRKAEFAGNKAEAAGANLKKAANELERASKLHADNLISESDYEAARANAEVARGQLTQLAARRAASAGDERSAEILRLLDEDLRLAEEKLNIFKRQKEVGIATGLPVMQMEAELIGLRRNKAAHEGKADEVSRLFDAQIKVLEELHRAIANGSDADRANLAIDVQRQIVALRRQKLETAASAATAP